MIIVEGPDGCGKSTLVQRLHKDLLNPTIAINSRGPRPGRRIRGEVKHYLGLEVKGLEKFIYIFDRFYFSELIYSTVLGRECAFTGYDQDVYNRVIQALEIPVILCLPPWEAVERNWVDRTDDVAGVDKNLKFIWDKYQELPPHFQMYRYDYTSNEPQQYSRLVDRLNQHLLRRKDRIHG